MLDRPGRLVAHPDISLVLRADEAAQRPLQDLRATLLTRPGQADTGQDIAGKTVLAAMAPIPGVDWSVIVKQPLAEAFRRSTRRSGARRRCSSAARPSPRSSPTG